MPTPRDLAVQVLMESGRLREEDAVRIAQQVADRYDLKAVEPDDELPPQAQ